MRKDRILQFVGKYNLGGSNDSVKWITDEDGICTTSFITDDKSVLGNVSCKDFNIGASEIGVFETGRLKQLLSVLGDELDVSLNENNDKYYSIGLQDSTTKVNFMLSDLKVIPRVPALKRVPDFDVELTITNEFARKFIRSVGALSDVSTFTLVPDGDSLQLVIGYSKINTNRIAFDVVNEGSGTLEEPINFSAKYLKEILSANIESETSTLKVSSEGLGNIKFETGDFTSDYYLVEVKNEAN